MSRLLFTGLPLRIRVVIAVTAFFLAVAAILAVLIAVSVRDMTSTATSIDDARARHAAKAAIAALQEHLSATARDNTVWDDGYEHITSPEAKEFSDTTWGKSTIDNPLFDASIVVTPQQTILSSYKKGQEFDPHSFFDSSLADIIGHAKTSGRVPVVSFVRSADGLAIMAAGMIRPYNRTIDADAPLHTLVLVRFMSAETLDEIEQTFDLDDLSVSETPEPHMLSVPLNDADGNTLTYLQWESREPGTMIYDRVHGYLLTAAIVLAAFLVAVLVTGFMAVRMLQRSTDRARHRATHDVLSGLLNRAGILEKLDKAIAADRADLMLHLIDLDGFKGVNDAWGHAVGDELIKLVAARVQSHLPADALFARLGGDEFAVATPLHTATDLAQRIVDCVAEPFMIGGRTIEIGASIGTVTAQNDVPDALELLRRADMALYTAKEGGRGQAVTFTANLDNDRLMAAELEDRLRRALERGEIQVAYQPLFDAQAGRVVGVEALAQWVPITGRVSPEIFIPIAERSGLIDQLGMQVLKTAIEQAQKWKTLALSVNVSPIQLRNPNFPADVIRLLDKTGFDPHRLTLEITEGVLMSNPDQARRAIEALRNIGVKFALDDFGCGYASIGALRTFGFDRMKIDRSLVSGLKNREGSEVLTATISLAHALNIPVTAEGVETPEQMAALKQTGCDQLQGFLLGRPMSGADIAALVRSSAA
ncbi:EAL domain-containing protein [Rhizobiales bacterium RZME27]|uniref:EAL domain-containing protein n=1 Tax=Endobacterium cereale TaxID=2663029 RepID=A0A6A8AGI6_9HYPH|nr:bifunctional diguanylate cyclase/phosphodiesterase [Endobacterium cereale]MEB2844661.1 bifunctional diguanylate cyclase/phosphodiesterase [Endobacterium cereale]MQY49944.1 EAL domain-containing protein [Endobacterium cereale]